MRPLFKAGEPVIEKYPFLKLEQERMRIAELASLLLLIAGCQYDPYVEVYTTTRPDRVEVAGRYVLTMQIERGS